MGTGIWTGLLWLSLSTLLLGAMLSFEPKEDEASCRRRNMSCVWRFIRGDMAVGGTVRIGLGLGGAGWWCGETGLLTTDLFRSLLVVAVGACVLIALFNAGRKGPQSVAGLAVLAGCQGAGWMGLILMVLRLWGLSA